VTPSVEGAPRVVCIGGGHGLAVTLRACQPWAGDLTAIVSVADDGGSSGRLRASHPKLPAPGDLRRCLTTLAAPDRATVAAALERRLQGGELDGHAVGNLLLLALTDELGDFDAAVAATATLLGVTASVLPASIEAVDLVGTTTAAGEDVRGQVAVEAAAESVRTVRLDPPDPQVPKAAIVALAEADLVVLGPGSLLGSVLAAVVAPALLGGLGGSKATTVLVLNLRSAEDDVAALRRHGVEPDVVVADPAAPPPAGLGSARLVVAGVARPGGLAHDPEQLGAVLAGLSR
jgi:uncharacterized cofD-like protein